MATTAFHISTAGTFTIQSGANATLHSIVVNNPGATATVNVYDNTTASGTKIAVLGGMAPGTLFYDIPLTTGLTVVTAGGTPPDITVITQ